MKKIASFMYAVIFAVSIALIAVLVVVIIGKYDYNWVYNEEIPDINPEYVDINNAVTSGGETTAPVNTTLDSMIEVRDIGGWELNEGFYKCDIGLCEVLGKNAKLSYLEYALFEGNTCYGVYYESFTDDIRDEAAMLEPYSEMVWTAKLPFSTGITLLRLKVVWTDSNGNIGEKTVSVSYGTDTVFSVTEAATE